MINFGKKIILLEGVIIIIFLTFFITSCSKGVYELSFDSQGGNAVQSLVLEYNEEIVMPEEPKKEDYAFKGWFEDAKYSTRFSLTAMPKRDLLLYAKWEAIEYTISFTFEGNYTIVAVKNGNSFNSGDKVTIEDEVSFSIIASQGYTAGILKASGSLRKFENNVLSKVKENITISGSAKPNIGFKYKVEHYFEDLTNQFVIDESKTEALYGEEFSLVRGEYLTLNGFNSDLENQHTFSSGTITADGALVLKLYYVRKEYKVSYQVEDEEIKIVTVKHGGNVGSTETPLVPHKDGYDIIAAVWDDNGSNITSDRIIKAVYTINKYTVTFYDSDGEILKDLEVNHGENVSYGTNPLKDMDNGYTYIFNNWMTSATGNIVGNLQNITQNQSCYAKYVATAREYNVVLNANGGSYEGDKPNKYTYGEGLALPSLTKEGYIFQGWTLTNESNDQDYITDIDTTEYGDKTFYAKWEEDKRVIVTFDTVEGNDISAITSLRGAQLELPPTPSKDNCVFVGWYLESNYTTIFNGTTLDNDFTLYAKWNVYEAQTAVELTAWATQEPNTYEITTTEAKTTIIKCLVGKDTWSLVETKISYNVKGYQTFILKFKGTKDVEILFKLQNGGVEILEYRLVMTGEEQTIYWNVQEKNLTNGDSPMNFYIFVAPQKTNVSASVEIIDFRLLKQKAETSALETAIFFESNLGTLVAPLLARVGSNIFEPIEPLRNGYIFKGWYLDKDFNNVFIFDVMPSQRTVLYAKWEEDKRVIVTFDTVGGNDISAITSLRGAHLELPTNPSKDNCVFVGWYLESNYTTIFNGTTLDNDFTLYAKWISRDSGLNYSSWSNEDEGAYNIVNNEDGSVAINSTDRKGEWSYIKANFTHAAVGHNYVRLVVTAQSEIRILLKQRGVEKYVTLTGGSQEIVWEINPYQEIDDYEFLIFIAPQKLGEGHSIVINSFNLYQLD